MQKLRLRKRVGLSSCKTWSPGHQEKYRPRAPGYDVDHIERIVREGAAAGARCEISVPRRPRSDRACVRIAAGAVVVVLGLFGFVSLL
jgi:hypothetical protein